MIPFRLKFKHPHEFDAADPMHRHADETLPHRVETDPDFHEQMLTWLVRGAVRWYAAGTPNLVDSAPPILKAAKEAYKTENDALGGWIMDNCTVGPQERVEASVLNFAVKSILGHGVKTAMEKRGFAYKKLTVDGKKVWVYEGVSYSSQAFETENDACNT